ncbi:septal ring lytic transglycosylase RlpA family protein [Flavobacterium columnare]|uniref:Probable endolytic peptidoglycan transglycosylase RlpA n=2 Tax=Flavobacteriaceae TaxID=49546 RepID=A0AA94JPY0_9FLAO|nr:septal ring lytic transglycosylase RlpA family protein [Flavobacterium columnare]MCH4832519.1 septal ring lytic transglycosylase RlpA family protein [Flavobacterium columnare]
MINRILMGVSTLLAILLTSKFSFKKFDSTSFEPIKIVPDTIKKDSLLLILDSLSVEEGLYNFKLYKSKGHASYYANRFNGRRTASGERFYNHKLTAAHRKLPFGTRVRVTNLKNGRKIIVKINDRGPHIRNREIDLSHKAFHHLAKGKGGGEMPVKIEIALKKEKN